MIKLQNNYKLVCFAVSLCLLLTLFFTTIVKDWRFSDDNYGAVYTATKVKTVSDVLAFFGPNHNDLTTLPTNMLETYKNSFSSTTFRPLTLVWYFFVSKMLDPDKPYNYFLFSIFLHVLATLLLFFAFLSYLSPQLSFFAAFLFGVFSYNGTYLGQFVYQPYSLSLILNLLGFFCIQSYFSQRKILNTFLATLCFLCSIFMHEANYSYVFLYYALFWAHRTKNTASRTTAMLKAVVDTIPFFVALLLCAVAKYLAYPPLISTEPFCTNIFRELLSFCQRLKYRFYDFLTFVVDMQGYGPIPSGNFLLKFSLLFIDIILFFLLFFCGGNTTVLVLLGLFVVQCWPCILRSHIQRYLYFALPYFILAIFLMYGKLQNSFLEKLLKKALQIKYFCVLVFGMMAIRTDLLLLGKKFVLVDNVLRKLALELNQTADENNLCFAGLPYDYFPVASPTQAIWLYTGNDKRKIFYDYIHTFRLENADFLMHQNICKVTYDKTRGLLRMQLDPKLNAYFIVADGFGNQISCSTGTITRTDGIKYRPFGTCREMEIRLHKNVACSKIVIWDYQHASFKYLD